MQSPQPKGSATGVTADRRYPLSPRRQKMLRLLNRPQRFELRRYENAGWALHFVRHPTAGYPMPVLVNQHSGSAALLEPDGSLNTDHQLSLRSI